MDGESEGSVVFTSTGSSALEAIAEFLREESMNMDAVERRRIERFSEKHSQFVKIKDVALIEENDHLRVIYKKGRLILILVA